MIAQKTTHLRRLFSLCAMFFALGAVACGGGADHPGEFKYDQSGDDGENTEEEESQDPEATDSGTPSAQCLKDQTQECKITLPSQGSVKNCVTGLQFCNDGVWSACEPDPM